MKELRIRHQKGFTIVELLVVIVLVSILTAIAVPVFHQVQDRFAVTTLRANQRILMSTLRLLEIDNPLPPPSGNNAEARTFVRDHLIDSGLIISNPVSKSTAIISSQQAQWASGAAVVVSQRSLTMDAAVSNPTANLYPLNSTSEPIKNRLNGALIIQISLDGYLFYYYFNQEAHDIRFFPIRFSD